MPPSQEIMEFGLAMFAEQVVPEQIEEHEESIALWEEEIAECEGRMREVQKQQEANRQTIIELQRRNQELQRVQAECEERIREARKGIEKEREEQAEWRRQQREIREESGIDEAGGSTEEDEEETTARMLVEERERQERRGQKRQR